MGGPGVSVRIACQPLRDVLIVGGGATLVRAVKEEPGHRDGWGGVKGGGICVSIGSWALLGAVGSDTAVVRMMDSQ